jgi:hypothetical protein
MKSLDRFGNLFWLWGPDDHIIWTIRVHRDLCCHQVFSYVFTGTISYCTVHGPMVTVPIRYQSDVISETVHDDRQFLVPWVKSWTGADNSINLHILLHPSHLLPSSELDKISLHNTKVFEIQIRMVHTAVTSHLLDGRTSQHYVQ